LKAVKSRTAVLANAGAAITSNLQKGKATARLANRLGTDRLLAAADPGDPSISKAAEYLVQQQKNGSGTKTTSTGTGSVRFLLKYHLTENSFPLRIGAVSHQRATRKNFCAVKFRPEEFRLRSGF